MAFCVVLDGKILVNTVRGTREELLSSVDIDGLLGVNPVISLIDVMDTECPAHDVVAYGYRVSDGIVLESLRRTPQEARVSGYDGDLIRVWLRLK